MLVAIATRHSLEQRDKPRTGNCAPNPAARVSAAPCSVLGQSVLIACSINSACGTLNDLRDVRDQQPGSREPHLQALRMQGVFWQRLLELPSGQQDQLLRRIHSVFDSGDFKLIFVVFVHVRRVIILKQCKQLCREAIDLLDYGSCPLPIHAVAPAERARWCAFTNKG